MCSQGLPKVSRAYPAHRAVIFAIARNVIGSLTYDWAGAGI